MAKKKLLSWHQTTMTYSLLFSLLFTCFICLHMFFTCVGFIVVTPAILSLYFCFRHYHNSYSMLDLAVCIHTFTTSPSYVYYNMKSRILKEASHLIFQKVFSDDLNTLLKCILSFVHGWGKIVLAIRLWFTIYFCFTIMSYDGLVYFLICR